ncbi:MAG: hypothetical protein ACRDWT_17235 [Jatrophihabitantaceae bacterium]
MSESHGVHRRAQPRPSGPMKADDNPVLPTSAPEDRDEAWGVEPRSAERDAAWYERERPPHHE